MTITDDQLQYLYCAVCLECQDILQSQGKEVQLAITIVNGHATCEEHRRRVSFGFSDVVRNARKFYTDGPRSQRPGNFR